MMKRTVHTYDLTNCDREPIHIPGNIQGHGLLLGCRADTLEIVYASENCEQFLGITWDALLGTHFLELIDPAARNATFERMKAAELDHADPYKITLSNHDVPRTFDVLTHRSGDVVLIEFEAEPTAGETSQSIYQSLRTIVSKLRSSATLEELYSNCVHEVNRLTGFDRVNIYRFDEKWNGHVLAEKKSAKGDSYLDLHFPASDIPKQARELYMKNPIRSIADVHRPPVLVRSTGDRPPLDMSLATLRGVSPVHLEYLRNMEVTASMSISLLKDGRLWGLVSCTHLSGPRRISFATPGGVRVDRRNYVVAALAARQRGARGRVGAQGRAPRKTARGHGTQR